MKTALILAVLCLALSPVARAADPSLGEEAISRLTYVFGLVPTVAQTKVLQGRTFSGGPCELDVATLTTEEASPSGIGLIDLTLKANAMALNFRAMSGQILGLGASFNNVQLLATHQDGMFSSTMVTQSLNVWILESVRDTVKSVTVSITDGQRGTLACAF